MMGGNHGRGAGLLVMVAIAVIGCLAVLSINAENETEAVAFESTVHAQVPATESLLEAPRAALTVQEAEAQVEAAKKSAMAATKAVAQAKHGKNMVQALATASKKLAAAMKVQKTDKASQVKSVQPLGGATVLGHQASQVQNQLHEQAQAAIDRAVKVRMAQGEMRAAAKNEKETVQSAEETSTAASKQASAKDVAAEAAAPQKAKAAAKRVAKQAAKKVVAAKKAEKKVKKKAKRLAAKVKKQAKAKKEAKAKKMIAKVAAKKLAAKVKKQAKAAAKKLATKAARNAVKAAENAAEKAAEKAAKQTVKTIQTKEAAAKRAVKKVSHDLIKRLKHSTFHSELHHLGSLKAIADDHHVPLENP